MATFTAYAIQTAQAVADYKIDVSASTSTPQIVYDDTLGYYYLDIKVVDANAAPQGYVSVIFSLDGSGHLVESENNLVNSLHRPTNAHGVAGIEYRPDGGTGKITAHIRYTHERYTVTYFYRVGVKVEDGNERAVSNQNVTFEITSPSTTGSEQEARLFSSYSQTPNYRLVVPTNSSGVAEVTLQLVHRPSEAVTSVPHTIVARMEGRDVVFRATATVPIPDRLELISGNNQTGDLGANLSDPFKVKVIDTRGNNVVNQAVTFVITQGGGRLSDTTARTDPDGIAQTYLRLGNTVETTIVEARLNDLTPVIFTAQSESAPSRITLVSGNNQTAYKNVQTDDPLRVQVRDVNREASLMFKLNLASRAGSGICLMPTPRPMRMDTLKPILHRPQPNP